jgi:tetratricopeptide (TPR) repeat protein
MARWWTKPSIILAALGVLAVLLPARLSRTPITQHTSGAGSGEQALQEALTTYRQLAQAQPQTYLPEVAMTLYNLGLLYRDTQRLREGEQAYQEALTTYRQLAQAQPQAYLPKVAMILHNLGIVRLDQEDLPQAQTLMTEALTIRRALWKHRAEAEGNDLGPSLAVEIMMSQRQEEAVTLICERLHKMAQGARGEHLKQWAKERAVKVCKRGR